MQLTQLLNSRRSIAVLVLMSLIFVLGYYSSLAILFAQWSGAQGEGYSHGFLVLASSLYLLYLRWGDFSALPARANLLGLLPLGFLVLCWFAVKVAGIQMLELSVLPAISISLVFTIFGYQVFKRALLPLSLLFFALPMWQLALPVLQDITTFATHVGIKLIGRPVYVTGNYVHVSGGSFVIEEACSGLRFLLVAITLTLLNSALNRHRFKEGVSLLLFVVALSFLANWIRVISVILLGDFTQMQHPMVADHANFGWVVFVIVVLVPYFVVNRYVPVRSEAAKVAALGSEIPYKPNIVALLVIAFVLVSGPLLREVLSNVVHQAGKTISVPQAFAGWSWKETSTTPAGAGWHPAYKGASQRLSGTYRNAEQAVNLDIVYYRQQSQGSELINVENHLTDDVGWTEVEQSDGVLDLSPATDPGQVKTALVRNSKGEAVVVWYWFNIGGNNTVSSNKAKILQLASFMHGRTDAALYALSVKCTDDCEKAKGQLLMFSENLPELLKEI